MKLEWKGVCVCVVVGELISNCNSDLSELPNVFNLNQAVIYSTDWSATIQVLVSRYIPYSTDVTQSNAYFYSISHLAQPYKSVRFILYFHQVQFGKSTQTKTVKNGHLPLTRFVSSASRRIAPIAWTIRSRNTGHQWRRLAEARVRWIAGVSFWKSWSI